MAKDEEVTRSQLAQALDRSNALVEAQAQKLAELETKTQVMADLLKGASPSGTFYTGQKLKTERYNGFVKALEKCVVSHPGPDGTACVHVHEEGDVFGIDVDGLWSDDPFVPVEVKGYQDEAQLKPITVPHPTARQSDFRFRRHAELDEKPLLRRAAEY